MKRLYWKVLTAMLLTVAVVVAVTFWTAETMRRIDFDAEMKNNQWQTIGRSLIEQYQKQGRPAVEQSWKEQGVMLMTPDLKLIRVDDLEHRRPFPRDIYRLIKRGPPPGGYREDRSIDIAGWRLIPVEMTPNADPYWLVIDQPRRFDNAQRERLPIYLAMAVVIVALGGLLITRFITQPVSALSQATRELSRGYLSTRVDESVLRRRDELGRLGKDFNTMAARLQSLLEDQQQLLRDISHELRTPLARLQIALEIARHRSGDEISRELNRIEAEGEALNELIDEVLTLVRANQPDDDRTDVDMAELWQERVELAQLEATARCLKFDCQLDSGIEITGQERWLGRAMDNLIRNAMKYTPEASTVHILQERISPEHWFFEIRDEGEGASEDSIEHLFKPFYRGDAARQSGGGYGIGLAIVDRVIRFHGGELSCRNAKEGGLIVRADFIDKDKV
ncbi:sensor histidine kinase [Pokkaliibacter sp. CJK22405]|uniref:sensor histidine kinase n=1 Tax=Pokkaliibacter sp. CJK22405 TaxID=3384615 RepID=UPI003984E8CD